MIAQRKQQGFAIVTAIFLIVALAALGTFMIRMSGVQSESISLSIQGARVFQAARSGVEWGLYQVLVVGDPCPAPSTFPVQGFSVTVTCDSSDHPINGTPNGRRVYVIRATARFGTLGAPTFVQRAVEIRANKLLP
jgi:MSHA biogenesis protein MshP